jgi:hypothetical protein
MRLPPKFPLFAIALAAFIAHNPCAKAQSDVTTASAGANQGATSAPATQTPASSGNPSDQTLEIAPRISPPLPVPPPPSEPDSGGNLNDSVAPPDGAPPVPEPPASANSGRPYLGISVQTIYSDDRPGRVVSGLEVVSVDNNSPAAIAGLRGRTRMTSAGESGATVGALVPPLDLIVMPLLKKTGALGQGGDLIIAIDDRRVANDFDLQSELESLKPGDTIYLTIVRAAVNGSQQTVKLPIKLGDASRIASAQATNAGDSNEAQPSVSSTVTGPKLP